MKSFRFSRFIHSIVMLGFLMPIAAQSQATWKQRTLDRAKQITQRAKSGSERTIARIAATIQLGKQATIKRLEREYALVKTGAKAARKKLKGQSLSEDEKKDLRSLEIRAGALVALMILAVVTTGSSAIWLRKRRPEDGGGAPPGGKPEAPEEVGEIPAPPPVVAPVPRRIVPVRAHAPEAVQAPEAGMIVEQRIEEQEAPSPPERAAARESVAPRRAAPPARAPRRRRPLPPTLPAVVLPDIAPEAHPAGIPETLAPAAAAEEALATSREEIDRGMQNINQLVFSGEATLESDQNTLNMINRLREALIDANRNYGTQNWIETHLDNLGRFEETVRSRTARHEAGIAERRPAPPLPPRDVPAPSVSEQVAARARASRERATEKQREIDKRKSELAELPSTSQDARMRRRRAILEEEIGRLERGLPAKENRPRQEAAGAALPEAFAGREHMLARQEERRRAGEERAEPEAALTESSAEAWKQSTSAFQAQQSEETEEIRRRIRILLEQANRAKTTAQYQSQAAQAASTFREAQRAADLAAQAAREAKGQAELAQQIVNITGRIPDMVPIANASTTAAHEAAQAANQAAQAVRDVQQDATGPAPAVAEAPPEEPEVNLQREILQRGASMRGKRRK